MKRILVLYYSMYGHIEAMADAVAEGARRVEGVQVDIKRVAETMPEDAFKAAGINIPFPHREVIMRTPVEVVQKAPPKD